MTFRVNLHLLFLGVATTCIWFLFANRRGEPLPGDNNVKPEIDKPVQVQVRDATAVTNYDKKTGIDVSREPTFFKVEQRKGDVVYLDTFGVHTISNFEIAGQHIQSMTDMDMEMETTVKTLNQGGQSIDSRVTHISFVTETPPIAKVVCNSDDKEQTNPMCQPVFAMLEGTNHYVIDDEGVVAEASGAGAERGKALTSAQQRSKGAMGKLQVSQQLEQTARLLKLIPSDIPIKPGSSWDASVDMGDMGDFSGDALLEGYKIYEGRDCAIISTVGTLDMDLTKLASAMGGGLGAFAKSMKLEDATMKSTLYFDYKEALPRWSETDVSMVVSMLDPLSQRRIEIPMTEVILTVTKIKGE